ncbi:MAG: DUF4338 domain-containing protein [Elusimicrobiales bacterium]|nr:DUF4338 domain-containing protein [Elusimicrobiales bacterium]
MPSKSIEIPMPQRTSQPRLFDPHLPMGPLQRLLTLLNTSKGKELSITLKKNADTVSKSKFSWKLEEEAILLVLANLADVGWKFRVVRHSIYLIPPSVSKVDPQKAKELLRQSLLQGRNQQLANPNVKAFLTKMHTVRTFKGKAVSIENLLDNGADLAEEIFRHREKDLSVVADPYLQPVEIGEQCKYTGLDLMDIWRYFRHTWSLEYRPTPGRSLCFLIRNAARPFHPVMGIIGLANAVYQLSVRDEWIGWTTRAILLRIQKEPDYWAIFHKTAVDCLKTNLKAIRHDDLLEEIGNPTSIELKIKKLRELAIEAGNDRRDILKAEYKKASELDSDATTTAGSSIRRSKSGKIDWKSSSESPLFRRKRAEVLADIFSALNHLARFRGDTKALLSKVTITGGNRPEIKWLDEDFGRAFQVAVREIKKNGISSRILDVNVCGATPVYREILGGKLAALSLFAKEIGKEYERRYSSAKSEIASSMAGRGINKSSKICILTTTSLYGIGSSQYNRVRMNFGTRTLGWEDIGSTEGFGTIHFSKPTIEVLRKVAISSAGMRNVNNKFGEGTSPLLRQLREGLTVLGFDPDCVLHHNQRRIVYGLELYPNSREDLVLNRTPEPKNPPMALIAKEWIRRWFSMRAQNNEVIERLKGCTPESVKNDLAISDAQSDTDRKQEEI